jgi:hypothetical protein
MSKEKETISIPKPIDSHEICWAEITKRINKVKGRYFVYVLINKENVIYVGRSFNLYSRLCLHKYQKQFDSVYLEEYKTYAQCCEAEKYLIKHYIPIENIYVGYHKKMIINSNAYKTKQHE